jgi:hypothetical protein
MRWMKHVAHMAERRIERNSTVTAIAQQRVSNLYVAFEWTLN